MRARIRESWSLILAFRDIHLEDTYSAIHNLEKALKWNPSSRLALQMLGTCLSTLGDFEYAIEVFERLEEPRPDSFSRRSYLAYFHCRLGNFATAINLIESLRNDANETEFRPMYSTLAQAYAGVGQWEEASESSIRALDHNKDDASAIWHMFVSLWHLKRDTSEALRLCQDARVRSPKDATLALVEGRIQHFLGRTEESRHTLQEALRLAPSQSDFDEMLKVLSEEGISFKNSE